MSSSQMFSSTGSGEVTPAGRAPVASPDADGWSASVVVIFPSKNIGAAVASHTEVKPAAGCRYAGCRGHISKHPDGSDRRRSPGHERAGKAPRQLGLRRLRGHPAHRRGGPLSGGPGARLAARTVAAVLDEHAVLLSHRGPRGPGTRAAPDRAHIRPVARTPAGPPAPFAH